MHYEKFKDGTVNCIEDEIPFEIPNNWSWRRLGYIGTWQSGATPSRNHPEYFGGDIPWLKTGDLNDGLINSVSEYITQDGMNNSSVVLNPIGSVLIAMYGATIGKLGIANIELTTNQACCACLPLEGINNLYLFYFLLSQREKFILRGTGGAQPNISKEKIVSTLFPVPPYLEQIRIINNIEYLMKYISTIELNKGDLYNLIKVIKSKILDLAIRGQIVPQDPNDEPASVLLDRIRSEKEELIKQGKIKRDKKESIIFRGEDNSYYETNLSNTVCIDDKIPFEIPNNWSWCNLSMIGSTNIGLTYKPTDVTTDKKGTIVLRSCNIVDKKMDYNDIVRVNKNIKNNQYVETNDILICARNGSKALVGKCALLNSLEEKMSFGAFMAVFRTTFYKYAYLYFNTQCFRRNFENDDTKQINQVTQDILKYSLIPLPPLNEQIRIAKMVKNYFDLIDIIGKNI